MINSKNNRRDFFKLSAAAIATSVSAHSTFASSRSLPPDLFPLPPGAVSLERFKSKCTACQLCVNHCPSGVLKPSLFENGLTGMMQPVLRFEVEQFCEYDCKKCIDVCPNDALVKMTIEEKKLTQIGKVELVFNECIVKTAHEDCGACAEHCPTAALKMIPWKYGLTRPMVVNIDVCIGCGGCESICPVTRVAMYVNRNEVHIKAKTPIVEKQEDVEIDGFGF